MPFGQYTATTALTQMVPANSRRISLLIKSLGSNATTAFLKMTNDPGTATTATLMPLQPGESIFMQSNFGDIAAADFPSAISVISGTGGEDIRWIDFSAPS